MKPHVVPAKFSHWLLQVERWDIRPVDRKKGKKEKTIKGFWHKKPEPNCMGWKRIWKLGYGDLLGGIGSSLWAWLFVNLALCRWYSVFVLVGAVQNVYLVTLTNWTNLT